MLSPNHPIEGSKSREEIAALYGIHYRTLMRRLKKAGVTLPSGAVFPAEQKLIYEALGPPQVDAPKAPIAQKDIKNS